jgi:hypothetical protein
MHGGIESDSQHWKVVDGIVVAQIAANGASVPDLLIDCPTGHLANAGMG